MSIQEVRGTKDAPAYQNKKKVGSGEKFQESLLQNLKSRGQEEDACADPAQSEKRAKEPSEAAMIGMNGSVRVNASMLTEAVQAAKVRYMRYEESDHVEIAVTEGYTLKGKCLDGAEKPSKGRIDDMTDVSCLKTTEGKTKSRVYVEAKFEDGRTEAYRVNVERVSQDTTHIIERFALETVQET